MEGKKGGGRSGRGGQKNGVAFSRKAIGSNQ